MIPLNPTSNGDFMKDVVVVGSLNMDTVIRLERFPHPGETLHGLEQFKFPGGKGLNQATSLSRLGNQVKLIGKIGQDKEGQNLLEALIREGVDVRFIDTVAELTTGNALILVDKKGNNEIIVMPGANKEVDSKFIESHLSIISKARFLLLQFEIPLDTIEYVIDVGKKFRIPVVVNPSPFYPIQDRMISNIDYLVLNETEAGLLLNMKIESVTDALEASRLIKQKGVRNVVVTLGEQGAVFLDVNEHQGHQPAFQICTVDSTAAGDAFMGGLLHALMENKTLADSVLFANAVGALTASKIGAQSSLPSFPDVVAFLVDQGQLSDKKGKR